MVGGELSSFLRNFSCNTLIVKAIEAAVGSVLLHFIHTLLCMSVYMGQKKPPMSMDVFEVWRMRLTHTLRVHPFFIPIFPKCFYLACVLSRSKYLLHKSRYFFIRDVHFFFIRTRFFPLKLDVLKIFAATRLKCS